MVDDALAKLKNLASASVTPKKDSTGIYVKVAMSVLTLVLPIGAILGFQSLGSLTAKIETLTSDVRQIDQLDNIKERLITLEQGDRVISHAQLSSSKSQYPTAEGGPLSLDITDSLHGDLEFDPRRDSTRIKVTADGGYFFVVAIQARRLEGYDGTGCLTVWMRVNDDDLQNSSVKSCYAEGTAWRATQVLVLQAALELHTGETVQIRMRSDPNGQIGAVAIQPEGVPLVPSAIFSVLAVGG